MKKAIIALFIVLVAFGFVYAQQSRPLNEANTDLISREDSVVSTDVKNKIAEDEMLRGLIISVTTADGIVTINGTTASQKQADRAVELAKKTAGVVSVVSKLKVDPGTALDVNSPTIKERGEIVEKREKELDEAADISGDTRITNEIKVKFAADDLIKARNIRIESIDGVVTLKGTVRNSAEQEQAIRLANSVTGVREVRNELLIDPAA